MRDAAIELERLREENERLKDDLRHETAQHEFWEAYARGLRTQMERLQQVAGTFHD